MRKQKTASTAVKGAVIEASANFDVIAYKPNAETCIEARFDNETVWLTKDEVAKLFGVSVRSVQAHIKNAICEELCDTQPMKDFFMGCIDGKHRRVRFYNLDAVLSVGYRVKSPRGVEFRRWANRMRDAA